MDIAYAAYTESATFMLDAKGICLWVAPSPSRTGTGEMWRGKEAADRCVGAQYVASVDPSVAGGLVELPRIGSPMIFAAVDANGRVSLLRSGPLLKFEAKTRRTSGVHQRPTARTPIAETGNPYEDEVATVKVRPQHLAYAAGPPSSRERVRIEKSAALANPTHRQSSAPPPPRTVRSPFGSPVTERSPFGVPGPSVRSIRVGT